MKVHKRLSFTTLFTTLIQVTCHGLVVMGLFFTGCSRRYNDFPAYTPFKIKEYKNYGVGRFKTTYLVDQLDTYYRGTNPGPIGVTTFVNLDDLYNTSTFGRVFAEQVMSELSMRGFDVVELRHSDALQFLETNGEFGLSRDVGMVRRERDLGGVIVGTYAVSPIRVYVNARLLDPSSSMVVAAGSVEMGKTDEIARLLRGGAFPATLERIPVKHLGLTTYPMLGWGPAQAPQPFFESEEFNTAPRFPEPVAPERKPVILPKEGNIAREH